MPGEQDLVVSKNLGYHFGGPYNKDYSILGSNWDPPIFGNYHLRFWGEGLGVGGCISQWITSAS